MKKAKLLPCPECKRKFAKIGDVNNHIKKTGCNESKKVTSLTYIDSKNRKTLIKNLLDEVLNIQ